MVASRELIDALREQVRRIELGERADDSSISLGCAALDALLPQRGAARGTIHEWLVPDRRGWPVGGSGAEILSLIAARQACHAGGGLVVIDSTECFYPPAAAGWGIDLDGAIIVRPGNSRDGLWAIDQALRCPAVAAVWGFLDRADDRWLRRFQLSAEQSGCLGLFVRPASVARRTTWADSQWLCRGFIPSPSFIPSSSGRGPGRGDANRSASGVVNGIANNFANRSTSSAESATIRLYSRHGARSGVPQTTKLVQPVLLNAESNDERLALGPECHFLNPLPSPPHEGGGIRDEGIGGEGRSEESRWIHIELLRVRGGVAGISLTLRIDFQTGSVQAARRDDETNRLRLSEQLAHPAVGRQTARA